MCIRFDWGLFFVEDIDRCKLENGSALLFGGRLECVFSFVSCVLGWIYMSKNRMKSGAGTPGVPDVLLVASLYWVCYQGYSWRPTSVTIRVLNFVRMATHHADSE